MKYSEPVVVQFQSDISLRNSSCAKFSCGGVFTPYQCARNFFSCENFSCSNYNNSLILNTMQKLTALSIVGRLENGLDTRIGASLYDDGIDLSGGETQKIVATRTLLDNADIWIFDEPVAAMDPSSEYSFFNTVLEEDDKSKTMIFVSHRLKIASKMNRIIYLENGKIVGIGTHQQLMTGCEKYRRYYVSWLLMEND